MSIKQFAYAMYCLKTYHTDFTFDKCYEIAQNINDQWCMYDGETDIDTFIEMRAIGLDNT